MTAQWKRHAQRAEERQAMAELERWVVPPDAVSEAAIARGYEIARRDGLAAYDPRGRVTVICGRCGQPALSETTPTILEHYTQAHGKAPRQMVLGRFEERCEVTR